MFLADLITYPFLQRALIGGIMVALVTSTIGILAVLRKASFFGDAIAHASLMGVALAIVLKLPVLPTALLIGILVSIVMPLLQRKTNLSTDSLLGLILPTSMAIAILIISLTPGYKPDLFSYLFGDILTISNAHLLFIGLIGVSALAVLAFFRGRLFATAFDPQYAQITGINILLFTIIHNLLLTFAIIPSLPLVGVVLVTALLIIPASCAKLVARSLKQMTLLSPLIGTLSTISGIILSYHFNLPSGPTIVLVLFFIYVAMHLLTVIQSPR